MFGEKEQMDVVSFSGQLENLLAHIGDLETRESEWDQVIALKDQQIGSLEKEKKSLEEEVSRLKHVDLIIRRELSKLKAEMQKQEEVILDLRGLLRTHEGVIGQVRAETHREKEKYARMRDEVAEKLSEVNKKLTTFYRERFNHICTEEEWHSVLGRVEGNELKVDQTQKELEAALVCKTRAQSECERLRKQLDERNAKHQEAAALNAAHEKLEIELEVTKKKLESVQGTMMQINRDEKARAAEYQNLSQYADSLEEARDYAQKVVAHLSKSLSSLSCSQCRYEWDYVAEMGLADTFEFFLASGQ